jgi:hypothetical protein
VLAYVGDDGGLKVLTCGDPSCSGGNTLAAVDVASGGFNADQGVSLALDDLGNPVISYFYAPTEDLRILRCGNSTCTADNSVTTPDSFGLVGYKTSLALDSAGNPVVAYRRVTGEATLEGLKILHCGDPTCSTGNTITSPDTGVGIGLAPSLVLDDVGNPVVSYATRSYYGRRLLHCGDSTCSTGNTIRTIDSEAATNFVGGDSSSLVLDSSGSPVVAYVDPGGTIVAPQGGPLQVVHCGDATCTAGNSVMSVDSPGYVGVDPGPLLGYPALQLDAFGNPIVSYWRSSSLRVLHCTDANCAAGLTIVSPDSDAGGPTSLVLDDAGNPVVGYAGNPGGTGATKVLHCGTPTCADPKADTDGDTVPDGADTDDDGDGCADVRELGANAQLGGQRNPYYVWDVFDTPDAANVRDGVVNIADISRLISRFGQNGSRFIDPLTAPPAAPAYHTAFDRTPGPAPWRSELANGSITVSDLSQIIAQFGHSCV